MVWKKVFKYFCNIESIINSMKNSSDVIIVKKTFAESQAMIYQARLNEAGIPCFVSNQNMNTVFPTIGGGIAIHVPKEYEEQAIEIINHVDSLAVEDNSVFTHHDATIEDIDYEKKVSEGYYNRKTFWPWIAAILVGLIIIRFIAKAMGFLPDYLDPF